MHRGLSPSLELEGFLWWALGESYSVSYKDLPEAAGEAGQSEGCCGSRAAGAGLDVPDLGLVLVPGTVRPLDGKFLAGQAPGKQLE